MKIYNKAILPIGFKASGVSCGLKKKSKLDLALFYSLYPARASAKFTSNKIKAAPVKFCEKALKSNNVFQAILVNSGNANCFTGNLGMNNAEYTAKIAATLLNLKKENVLVASTGIIGKQLAVNKIKKAMPQLVSSLSISGVNQAKRAILTTDKFSKDISVKFNIGSSVVTICGVAKGAGMIAPNMATMLCFIMTDANIGKDVLSKVLSKAVNKSFNCVTVDGCMSTNDTVMVLANAASLSPEIKGGSSLKVFTEALDIVCLELAKMLVRDGEGANKFIEIKIDKAKSYNDAKKAALAVANSNLFKTAIYGENYNFGRIAAAIGASGIDLKEEKLIIKVSSLKERDIKVSVSLNTGKEACVVYTSDLTPEYIKINADYN